MLEQVKRWWFSSSHGALDVSHSHELEVWSRQNGWDFKRAPEGDGFSIDGTWTHHAWRLEWGPSQRSYIVERELRLRMELCAHSDLQMMVLNHALVELLESQAFERYTQTTQTIIDSSAPEEMRWLAMHPQVSLRGNKILSSRFGVWSNLPSVAAWWLNGGLAVALEELALQWLPDDIPFVLMTLRGRLYLRAQIAVPSQELLAILHALFLEAAQEQLRVSAPAADPSSVTEFNLLAAPSVG